MSLHSIHKDYIKALSYSNETNTLFSCGFDGIIAQYNFEEMKNGNIYNKGDEIVYNQGQNPVKNSFYYLSCDNSGKLLLASMYENVRKNS
jgi:hypothetical protein